jgi:hypothetical protein
LPQYFQWRSLLAPGRETELKPSSRKKAEPYLKGEEVRRRGGWVLSVGGTRVAHQKSTCTYFGPRKVKLSRQSSSKMSQYLTGSGHAG